MMSFMDAVKAVYTNYAGFQGRAGRAEFWWFFLFYYLAVFVLAFIDGVITGGSGILYGLFVLGTIVPYLAVSVRRLHDTGKSGWWILIGFIPLVGWIVLIIFYVQAGETGDNKFGSPSTVAPAPTGGDDIVS